VKNDIRACSLEHFIRHYISLLLEH
jgi:hypothetical protein